MQSASIKYKLYCTKQQWKAYFIILYTKFVKEFSTYCPGRCLFTLLTKSEFIMREWAEIGIVRQLCWRSPVGNLKK